MNLRGTVATKLYPFEKIYSENVIISQYFRLRKFFFPLDEGLPQVSPQILSYAIQSRYFVYISFIICHTAVTIILTRLNVIRLSLINLFDEYNLSAFKNLSICFLTVLTKRLNRLFQIPDAYAKRLS